MQFYSEHQDAIRYPRSSIFCSKLPKGWWLEVWGGGLHLRNNLLVYSVEISSRSQTRWIYSGPILEVANEYTPGLIMLRLHHEETHRCVNGGRGEGGEFAAYCRALRIQNFFLGSMRDNSVRLLWICGALNLSIVRDVYTNIYLYVIYVYGIAGT